MSQKTRAQLEALKESLILTGGRRTTAANVREMFASVIESLSNILDDKDQPEGFLGIDSDGNANVSLIKAETPAGKYLRDDGTFKAPFSKGNKRTNGDGTTNVFIIPHGFGSTPDAVFVTPLTEDSSAQHWVDNITATDFNIVFKIAPPSGSNNVSFKFLAI